MKQSPTQKGKLTPHSRNNFFDLQNQSRPSSNPSIVSLSCTKVSNIIVTAMRKRAVRIHIVFISIHIPNQIAYHFPKQSPSSIFFIIQSVNQSLPPIVKLPEVVNANQMIRILFAYSFNHILAALTIFNNNKPIQQGRTTRKNKKEVDCQQQCCAERLV